MIFSFILVFSRVPASWKNIWKYELFGGASYFILYRRSWRAIKKGFLNARLPQGDGAGPSRQVWALQHLWEVSDRQFSSWEWALIGTLSSNSKRPGFTNWEGPEYIGRDVQRILCTVWKSTREVQASHQRTGCPGACGTEMGGWEH